MEPAGRLRLAVSPSDTTDLFQSPTGPYSVLRVSVPDVFSVKGGMGYTLWPRYGVTATLGARLDGIPIHDVFGASHGFRRPALIGFVDPSISISRGDSTLQIDVPVRIFYNFRRSEPGAMPGMAPNSATSAKQAMASQNSQRWMR